MCKSDTSDTESDYDMEELYTTCEELGISIHVTIRSLESYKHYNSMPDSEQSQLDTSSEDEHSLMDFEITPTPTHTVTTPQPPHPRPSRTCPLPAPRPSKVENKVTSCSEATTGQCKASHQAPPHPQTRKTPLLPTPPMPVQKQTRGTFISRPPQHSRNQHIPCVSRPHRQQPPLLPSPPETKLHSRTFQSASTILLASVSNHSYRPFHEPSSKSHSMSSTVHTIEMKYVYIIGTKT